MLKRLVLIVLMTNLYAQDLPDAPSVHKCGPWTCWKDLKPISNREVLRSPYFWGTFLGDVAISSSDAEFSHAGYAYHKCVERAEGLPRHASRWQLYQHNIEENASVGVAAFLWTKFRGPKWLTPAFIIYPAIVHGRADANWVENCW